MRPPREARAFVNGVVIVFIAFEKGPRTRQAAVAVRSPPGQEAMFRTDCKTHEADVELGGASRAKLRSAARTGKSLFVGFCSLSASSFP